MPQNAAAGGSVDFVLPPELIAAELAKLGHRPYILEDETVESMDRTAEQENRFAPILQLLRQAVNVDFSLCRENMIRRRIMRRLALRNLDSLEEYRREIENDSRELAALQRDLLIGVTQFFRDPASFEALKRFFGAILGLRPFFGAIGLAVRIAAFALIWSVLEILLGRELRSMRGRRLERPAPTIAT
jgi:hypothetical protein